VNVKNLLKSIETLKESAGNLIDEALTKDVADHMTPEQMEAVNDAKKALKFDGSNPAQAVREFSKMLDKHANNNK